MTATVFWACAALLLIALETLAPGILLLWFGFAAAGVFLLLAAGLPIPLLAQILVFVILSFVSVGVYWRFFRKSGEITDQPLLNRKQEQLLGKTVALERAIAHGEGRVQLGDAYWQVKGPDMPAGSLVRIVSVEDGVLRVVPAE